MTDSANRLSVSDIHRYLWANRPLYRLSGWVGAIALAIALMAGTADLIWPQSTSDSDAMPPPAVPTRPPDSNQRNNQSEAPPLSGDYALCRGVTNRQPPAQAQAGFDGCARILAGTATGNGSMPPVSAYLGEAIASMALGHNSDAYTYIGHAISNDPSFGNVYAVRAILDNETGSNREALDDANRALSLDPNNESAKQARAIAQKALGQTPSQSLYDTGTAAIAQGRYADGVTALQALVRAEPRNTQAYVALSGAELNLQNCQLALQYARQAVQLGATNDVLVKARQCR